MIASLWAVEQRALGPWPDPRAEGRPGVIAHGSVAMGQGQVARCQSADVREQESEFMASWIFLVVAMDFEFGLQKHSHMHMNTMKLKKLHL